MISTWILPCWNQPQHSYCCFYLSLSPNPYCDPLRIIWFWSVFSTQHRDGFCFVSHDQYLVHETAELNPFTFVDMISMFVVSSVLLFNINFRFTVFLSPLELSSLLIPFPPLVRFLLPGLLDLNDTLWLLSIVYAAMNLF